MRLVTDITELTQYHLCERELPYYEPFSNARDINIFYQLDSIADTYDINIEAFSHDGRTYFENVTALFYWVVAKDVNGHPYFVAKGIANSQLPQLFVLKITINAIALFTEPYESLGQGCQHPVLMLEGDFVCYDKAYGNYYGNPTHVVASNFCSPGTSLCELRYENTTIIRGRLKRLPTDIKRNVTEDTCRSISTTVAALYTLEGFTVFPEWKMAEIENIFVANSIRVNRDEYVFRGGNIFEDDDVPCGCGFLLKAKIESCPMTTEYGCETVCKTTCVFYTIPAARKDQKYYSDKGQPIAENHSQLLSYFQSEYGVEEITNIDVSQLDCQIVAAFKISGSYALPPYFYWGEIVPANKVMMKVRYCDWTDLCESIPPNCITPLIELAEFTNGCTTPEIASANFTDPSAGFGSCLFEAAEDWTDEGTTVTHSSTEVSIDLKVSNSSLAPGYFTQNVGSIGAGCRPQYMRTVVIDSTNVYIFEDGKILVVGLLTSGTSLDLEITYNL